MENNHADLTLFTVILMSNGSYDEIKNGIDSVFSQDYNNIEMIISHYGLKDLNQHDLIQYINTLSAKNKNVSKVRISTKERPVGKYRHINQAKELATGEYILFVREGGVLKSQTVISEFVKMFSENPSAMTVSGFYEIGDIGKQENITILPEKSYVDRLGSGDYKDAYYEIIKEMFIPLESTAFHRKAFDFVENFDENLKYNVEKSFFLNLVRQGNKPLFINKIITNHRKVDVDRIDKKIMETEEITMFESDIIPYLYLFPKSMKKELKSLFYQKKYHYIMKYYYHRWSIMEKINFYLTNLPLIIYKK